MTFQLQTKSINCSVNFTTEQLTQLTAQNPEFMAQLTQKAQDQISNSFEKYSQAWFNNKTSQVFNELCSAAAAPYFEKNKQGYYTDEFSSEFTSKMNDLIKQKLAIIVEEIISQSFNDADLQKMVKYHIESVLNQKLSDLLDKSIANKAKEIIASI